MIINVASARPRLTPKIMANAKFALAEAANYVLKYDGLYPLRISDFEALQKALPQDSRKLFLLKK